MRQSHVRTRVRSFVAETLAAGGFSAPPRPGTLCIPCYHRVLPQTVRSDYFSPSLVVTPEAFTEQVRYYAQHFDCRTLRDATTACTNDRSSERPLLAVTFDDGYWDVHHYARPILNEFGVPASIFVISSLVHDAAAPWYDRFARAARALLTPMAAARAADEGNGAAAKWIARHGQALAAGRIPELLTALKREGAGSRHRIIHAIEQRALEDGWTRGNADRSMAISQLRELVADGHEIGSHTCTHPILPLLDDVELRTELEQSRASLSEALGTPVDSLAYPNGDFDARVADAARTAGYRRAVTTEQGLNDKDADYSRLRRIFISQERTSMPDGRCSTGLLSLELSGWADALFLRRLRRKRP